LRDVAQSNSGLRGLPVFQQCPRITMNILVSCKCSNIFTIGSARRPAERVGKSFKRSLCSPRLKSGERRRLTSKEAGFTNADEEPLAETYRTAENLKGVQTRGISETFHPPPIALMRSTLAVMRRVRIVTAVTSSVSAALCAVVTSR
jgi:hypothetical protein